MSDKSTVVLPGAMRCLMIAARTKKKRIRKKNIKMAQQKVVLGRPTNEILGL